MIQLTDAQQAFADSAAGRNAIARARRTHDMREAHKGRNARPWTDAMQIEAVRDAALVDARTNLQRAEQAISNPRDMADAVVRRDTALHMRKREIATAWKKR